MAGEVARFEGARRQVHGRRRARLFRLARRRTRTTPSGRCAPGSRSSRPWARLRHARPGEPLRRRVGIATGLGRGRRPGRRGRGAGAGRGRRDAEPRRPAAGAGRARAAVVIAADHAPAGRRPVRVRRPRAVDALKGFAEPVRGLRGCSARAAAEGRFEALHAAAALTPLVGREQELALLLDRWQQAKEGEGQVVLLVGRAGHRQVAARAARCASELGGRAAHRAALLLLALPPEQRAPPGHRPARAGGRASSADDPPRAQARQARGAARTVADDVARRRAAARGAAGDPEPATATRRSTLSPQRQKERTLRGAARASSRASPRERPVLVAVRGRALGRPDHARAARPRGRARAAPAACSC